ncbi:MAG: adenosylcobalamin-dependent ribonucleoside-diphosphate reductase [Patescibacteria group bacterium]|nr:adenosylcobalamin-dependent ribonucleoside-diphosphate reductase [Patescibacteria group bacterium]
MFFDINDVMEKNLNYFGGDQLAANVVIEKYLMRDEKGNLLEETLDDIFLRITKEIMRVQDKYKDNMITGEELLNILKEKKAILQGSPLFGIGNQYSLTTLSNCYVVPSPTDSIEGIMDSAKELAILFKSRGGAGMRLDALRPEGSAVSNSARFSTGAWSFASLYSDVTKAIGQQGRRGALMLAMHVMHPDIISFITSKNDRVSITAANISVLFTDEFMKAVEEDSVVELRWPLEGTPLFVREERARKIWETFIESNIGFAEPGALFWDRMEKYTPNYSYDEFRPVCVNPCAEIAMGPRSNCRLGSINLLSFVKNRYREDVYFDYEDFSKVVRDMVVVMDDVVDLDLEKMTNLRERNLGFEAQMWEGYIQQTRRGREVGLGTHGLGDCLAAMRIMYGSEKSLEFCEKTYRVLRDEAYKASQELARFRGTFPAYNEEKERGNLFLEQEPNVLYGPRRNVSLLTSAPTGSISIVHQVSSGIEPIFMNSYMRRRKVAEMKEGCFVGTDGQVYEEYTVYHHLVQDIKNVLGGEADKYIQEYCVNAHQVDYKKKIDMQSVIQKYIDHSISNTYNLPKGITLKDVSDLYLLAWKKGLKGITIYVDGSRDGILVEKKTEKTNEKRQRPEYLPCEIHATTIKGQKWIVLVGLYEGKPYEVFCGLQEMIELSPKVKSGKIQKVVNKKSERNVYNLIFLNSSGEEVVLSDIVKVFGNDEHSALGRMISLSLRSGVKIAYVVEQLLKDHSSDFVSYSKVLARILKKYIPNGESPENGDKCLLCGNKLVFEDGCKVCKNCGWGGCS